MATREVQGSKASRHARRASGWAARAVATLLSAGALAAMPTTALACGGFFCFQQPIDQSAERILYVQNGQDITVHIQISYTGEDDQFSWILPLAKVPELEIGSDTIFSLLEQYTAPQFQLEWQQNGNCYGGFCFAEDATAGGGPPNSDGGSGGVKVLAQQNVGPYESVVIEGASGEAVVDWLNKNGYVQPPATKPLIDSYAQKKFVFLALRLQKDSSAGDIAPIVVKLKEEAPCLPIRLTALATQPDMPIVAWVLGNNRAIPKNYLHVEVNDAVFDWLNAGSNYKSVVSKAVDQGSGHAFLTELAKPTSKLAIPFVNASWQPKQLAQQTTASGFLMQLLEDNYPRSTQMQNLVRKYIPKPAAYSAVPDQEFYNCLSSPWNDGEPCASYKTAVAAQPFDAAAFAGDVENLVVEPLKKIDASWQSQRYVTRLFTTLSAEEMTKDPIFASNPDLPDVDNVRKAKALPICEGTNNQATAVKLTFADGHVLTVPVAADQQNACWGWGGGGSPGFGQGTGPVVDAGGQPLAKLQVLDESGAPLDVDPSVADKVDAQLNFAEVGKPSLPADFKARLPKVSWNKYAVGTPGGSGTLPDPTAPKLTSSAGCSAGRTAPSAGPLALLALLSAAGMGRWVRRRSAGL